LKPAACSKAAFVVVASLIVRTALSTEHSCPAPQAYSATNISIPAQPLNRALQALSAQTGLDILFESSTVAGLQGAAVQGRMKPGDALCLLLDDLGLVYSINADRTIVVSKRTATLGRVAGGPARDSSAHVARDSSDSEPAAQVIVTGTRRSDRSVADSLVPIAVISGESLAATGVADTAQSLSALVPSFNYPQPSLAEGTDIVRPATLRGLGPDEMLVLVNGKRRHASALLNINTTVGRGSAAVDMSMLPSVAIDRIEILRDGASALYGSDAIAGVVNVILKQQREGGDVSVTYGQTYTTIHGVPRAIGIQTGPDGEPPITPDGVYALQYAGDRQAHDGQTVTLSGNFGLPLGANGFLDIAVQGRDQSPTNRAGYDPREQYTPTEDGLADPREFTINRLSQRFGEPRLEDVNGVVNAGLPLAEGAAEWYAFGTYGVRYGLTQGFFRTAADHATVASIYPDGFLPQLKIDVDDKALVTGVRGFWRQWSYDLSINYGRDVIDFRSENTEDPSLDGSSPTSFYDGGLRYQEDLVNLDLQRDIRFPALDKPLSVSWGLEYGAERFVIQPGYSEPPLQVRGGKNPGAIVPTLPEFRSQNEARHSLSAYADLEQDIGSRWTLAAAGRAEQYSDFGSTLNYKIATRIRLTKALALRSAISTGFRAPSLQQQFFSNNSSTEMDGGFADVGTFAVTDPLARALGARDLKPERSTNLGAGFVYDGIRGLDVAVDWFRIAIRGRIALADNLGLDGTPYQNAAVETLFKAMAYAHVQAARFFVNGADTLTQGADIVASYSVPAQWLGHVRLSVAYSCTRTRITRVIDGLDTEAGIAGLVPFGPLDRELLVGSQPRSKLNLTAEWSWNGFGATLRTNRYGAVFSPEPDPLDDLLIEPAWVTDLELRYSPGRWQLALGANNLFDKYPTSEPTGPRPASLGGNYAVTNYIVPFSESSPFGFSGRYLYGRVDYRF
jgi:iron complex outermembrane receptor protein